MSKIGFERFTAMSDDVARNVVAQACGERRMSVQWRLWEITLCRINNWGHAAFDRHELQMLVCGAVGEPERRAIDRGFKVLIGLGRISPESTRLCVVVNDDLWRRGAGKGTWEDACSEAAHRPYRRHVWSAVSGWQPRKQDVATGSVAVPVPVSGVPMLTLAADPWATNG